MNFASVSSVSRYVRGLISTFEKIKRLQPKNEKNATDPRFVEIMKFVNKVHSTRNQTLRTYEDFFNGRQKPYFRKYIKEEDADYDRRLDQSVAINKCKQIVLKGARYLYTVKPPFRRMEEDNSHKRMMKVWEFNNVLSGHFHRNIASLYGLYGFAVISNRYINKDLKERLWVKFGEREDNEVQYVVHHPMLTIPIPRQDKQDEMGAVIIITLDSHEDPLLSSATPDIKRIQYISDEDWLEWVIVNSKENPNEIVGVQVEVNNGPEFINRNPYGDVNIPFTLYRNIGDIPFVLDGCSDLQDVTEIQNRYNQLISDDGHVIDHHTFPILAAFGFTFPDDFAHGVATNVSSRNADGDLKYVTWDAELEASARLEDRLEKQMRQTSGFSPISDGDLSSIGQVRNLKGAMMPEILTISDKQVQATTDEQSHARATLKVIEWHEETTYENKKLDIIFRPFVPVDRLTEVEAEAIEVKTGLEDIRDIIRQRNPELTDDAEIDAKVREIAEINKTLGIMTDENRKPSGQSGSTDKKEREQLEK